MDDTHTPMTWLNRLQGEWHEPEDLDPEKWEPQPTCNWRLEYVNGLEEKVAASGWTIDEGFVWFFDKKKRWPLLIDDSHTAVNAALVRKITRIPSPDEDAWFTFLGFAWSLEEEEE